MEPTALVYTTKTKGLIPAVKAVLANIVNAMVQPSIMSITANGATSLLLSLLVSATIFSGLVDKSKTQNNER